MKKYHFLAITVFLSLFLVLSGLALGVEDVPPTPRQGDIDSCGKPPGNGGGGGGGGGGGAVLLSPLTIHEVSAGVQYAATGGVMPYTWSISCESGSINSSGTITSLEGCCGEVSVTVKDGLGAKASLPIELDVPLLAVNGSETPVVNNPSAQYSASGGTPPYTWSFGGGSIDATGKITAINGCSGPGSPRGAMVTVTDSCGQTASKEVRLPGGVWVQTAYDVGECNRYEYDKVTITSGCGDHWAMDTAQKVYYCGAGYPTGTSIAGATKAVTRWGRVNDDGVYRLGTSQEFRYHWFVDSTGTHGDPSVCPSVSGSKRPFAWNTWNYKWVCP